MASTLARLGRRFPLEYSGLPETRIFGRGSSETRRSHASCSSSITPLMPVSMQTMRRLGWSMEKYIVGLEVRVLPNITEDSQLGPVDPSASPGRGACWCCRRNGHEPVQLVVPVVVARDAVDIAGVVPVRDVELRAVAGRASRGVDDVAGDGEGGCRRLAHEGVEDESSSRIRPKVTTTRRPTTTTTRSPRRPPSLPRVDHPGLCRSSNQLRLIRPVRPAPPPVT